jgi:hypothetical protein
LTPGAISVAPLAGLVPMTLGGLSTLEILQLRLGRGAA